MRAIPRFLAPLPLVPVVAFALAACAPADAEPEPYVPVADVQQLMLHVIEPAAEHYWDAVGWVIDFNGETAIRPTTDEEWEAVVNAAWTVTETANLLMMEPRAVDDANWISMSQALVEMGRRAVAAAETRNPQAVFDAGAELYYACTACHGAYATETLRPNVEPE